ncbi:M56 family metallopeptidase [Actinocorallia sp. A-T 12471]|uniref:M56 family metallopeptidase n=1 Tax=Actinocorallia sp. A-T 12471 TaxID=3089813 RepID=UPI0029D233C5|nr:M56 family metallopeptidase [Actinocorallia sp. A-T 12471]MDX6739423.1 M56 family metallopeptidase [Actinocorallia sp. A-T 12471]
MAGVLVAAGLLALSALLLGPLPARLARAPWSERAPRAALALWQAVTGAAALSLVGGLTAVAVAPLSATLHCSLRVFTAQTLQGHPLRGMGAAEIVALVWAVVVAGGIITLFGHAFARQAGVRRRHRLRLDLVGVARRDGAVVLDHDVPAAYCLPGFRPRVVVTSGLVALLEPAELAAVLDHERAHARGRHHLLLLPFDALATALPRLAAFRTARDSASRLVEMLADDHARARHGGRAVASALVRLAAGRVGSVPASALGAAERSVVARVRRLTAPERPMPVWQRASVYAVSAALWAATPSVLGLCLL